MPRTSACQKSRRARLIGPHVSPLTNPVSTSFVPVTPGSIKEERSGAPGLKSGPGGVAGVACSSALHGGGPSPANLPNPRPDLADTPFTMRDARVASQDPTHRRLDQL